MIVCVSVLVFAREREVRERDRDRGGREGGKEALRQEGSANASGALGRSLYLSGPLRAGPQGPGPRRSIQALVAVRVQVAGADWSK